MTEILKGFPAVSNLPTLSGFSAFGTDRIIWQAYVSVLFDKKRATVTASKATAFSLQPQLKGAGIIVADVGLRGIFCSQRHRDDVELLTKFCGSHPAFQFLDASELALPT
jgi:hypothetical protein